MSTSSITYYTAVDTSGNIVMSRFTTDPNYAIKPEYRLLADRSQDVVFDISYQTFKRIEPVRSEATEIEYLVEDNPLDHLIPIVKSQRNQLLFATDWKLAPDLWITYTESYKNALKQYRQALRDVPDQAGFPKNINWPTMPVPEFTTEPV